MSFAESGLISADKPINNLQTPIGHISQQTIQAEKPPNRVAVCICKYANWIFLMSLMDFFLTMMEKHDITVLPAVLVTVTYNCKNVIAPVCEELLQTVEMLLTIKAKKQMVKKEGQMMDKVSVWCAHLSLLPVNQAP